MIYESKGEAKSLRFRCDRVYSLLKRAQNMLYSFPVMTFGLLHPKGQNQIILMSGRFNLGALSKKNVFIENLSQLT